MVLRAVMSALRACQWTGASLGQQSDSHREPSQFAFAYSNQLREF